MHAPQSDFLELVDSRSEQAVQLAEAMRSASDAQSSNAELEHLLAWLAGAHAEQAAMHKTFKAEVRGHLPSISSACMGATQTASRAAQ